MDILVTIWLLHHNLYTLTRLGVDWFDKAKYSLICLKKQKRKKKQITLSFFSQCWDSISKCPFLDHFSLHTAGAVFQNVLSWTTFVFTIMGFISKCLFLDYFPIRDVGAVFKNVFSWTTFPIRDVGAVFQNIFSRTSFNMRWTLVYLHLYFRSAYSTFRVRLL